ncbi:MAG: UvrABC system protein A [Alphaproteobacteria bacterium MarineAlpha9_Bin1]|nr:MAG: UvrABC system protein A [Alphaproteobacteria bacterium MarineAlpha9_Bin1]
MQYSFINIKGASEHNLKKVNLRIPKNKLVVITGVSGSGKSSLAFDTIYAEGQRRYVESLSAYARQFLELMQKPKVESIEGLSPSIAINQKSVSHNPRSTVATVTEIYDYLRLLFSRVGIPYSPKTGKPITSQSISQMVDSIMSIEKETRIHILAPLVRNRKGEHKKEIFEFKKRGFQRIRLNNEIYDISQIPNIDKNKKHNIEILVDRIVIKNGLRQRLTESIETALKISPDGLVIVNNLNTNKDTIFSSKFACPVSGFTIEEIEPRLFSFNNPSGACKICDGLGEQYFFDKNLIIPDQEISINEGAIKPWNNKGKIFFLQALRSLSLKLNFSLDSKWKNLSEKIKDNVLNGTDNDKLKIDYHSEDENYIVNQTFPGVIPSLTKRFSQTNDPWLRYELNKYQSISKCSNCYGFRLNEQALSVKINDIHIGKVTTMTISENMNWLNTVNKSLKGQYLEIANPIIKEISLRLKFLYDVGLDYLSLDRKSNTLSGGESQRIRLASQIGSGLTGIIYVLDEPSIGLHQRDNIRLLETLKSLKNLGNTVIIVEHDEEAIMNSDYVVDIGPGAGENGGKIIAEGSPEQIKNNHKSITGNYLSGRSNIDLPKIRRKFDKTKILSLRNANINNLKNINVDFPLGKFICVTGVSGSGKSSLIGDTLYPAVNNILNKKNIRSKNYEEVTGIEMIDKIIEINQSPIGRTPRSNPATYTGAFTPIREWFSKSIEAKVRGYTPGRFSFNVKGGRCEACQGDGIVKIEMHFLPDMYVQCEECEGKRYNKPTLDITIKNNNINNILNMSVMESKTFFNAIPSINNKLQTLYEVGLGYIKLGQPATTLSGGEAQRIKLAKELSKRSTGKTLYILDEPTTGLHFEDVKKLLEVLNKLVDGGNTIIVIEHNLDVIKSSDWIIDLGPEGGYNGGKVIAEGTPEHIAKSPKSYTGKYINKHMNKLRHPS